MLKKKMGLILGLVALALTAVPAVASANELTDPLGSVPVGETITGTSTNAVSTTAVGVLTCKDVVINGNVEQNGAGTVTVGMDGAKDSAKECHRTAGATTEAVTVTPTFEHLHLDTNAVTTDYAKFSYVVHFPNLKLTCSFAATVDASAVPGGEAIQAEGELKGTSPAPCPQAGAFHATFALEDVFGPITIDS
jgi:hypothetical protein